MYPQADNGEGDGWQITANYHCLWVSFMFVVPFMYTPRSRLTDYFISTLSTMVASDASQTTPAQIKYVFMLCCSAQIVCAQIVCVQF